MVPAPNLRLTRCRYRSWGSATGDRAVLFAFCSLLCKALHSAGPEAGDISFVPADPSTVVMSATVTSQSAPSTSDYLGKVLYRSLHNDDRPPSIVSAEGIYYTLEDGRKILDCCGGAAVACLGRRHHPGMSSSDVDPSSHNAGNGNQEVIQAIKDQLDRCAFCCEQKHSERSGA